MTPEEEPSKPEASASAAKRPHPRRSRRGGRGRRRPAAPRSEGVAASSPATSDAGEIISPREPLTADAPLPDSEIEEARREAADEAIAEAPEAGESNQDFREPQEPDYEPEPLPRELPPPRPERRDFQPASPAAVTEAIEDVNRIMTSLRQVLDTMEEILETLELAEVQKTADEREIQSLRNAIRQMDRRIPDPRRESHEQQSPREQGREPRRQGRR